jgi:hypothetical protein
MEDLILHVRILYDYDGGPHSPPLPPTPTGEPIQVTYGSKTTKVANVPPPASFDSTTTLPPEDFTPRLPPRPNSSIHPSSRANAGSPTKLQTRYEKGSLLSLPDTTPEESPPLSPIDQGLVSDVSRYEKNSASLPLQDSSSTSSEAYPPYDSSGSSPLSIK